MDVQGAELEILISARKKLAQAVVVRPELRYYPLYEKEPMLEDVDNDLRAQGLELHKFLQLKRCHIRNSQTRRLNTAFASNQLLDGDAVYIRKL